MVNLCKWYFTTDGYQRFLRNLKNTQLTNKLLKVNNRNTKKKCDSFKDKDNK